jgi:phosphopentomutase
VPLLAFGPAVQPARLGTRPSFCDLGQTIAAGLGVAPLAHGDSFLAALRAPA